MKQLALYPSLWEVIFDVFGDQDTPNYNEMYKKFFLLLWDNGLIDHNKIDLNGVKGYALKEEYKNLSTERIKYYALLTKKEVTEKEGGKTVIQKAAEKAGEIIQDILTPVIDYVEDKLKNLGSVYDPDAIDAETKNPVAKQVLDLASGTLNLTPPAKKTNPPAKKTNPPVKKTNPPVKKDNPSTKKGNLSSQGIVVAAKPKWTRLPDKTVMERVANTNPGEAYTVLDKDTLSLIAKGWNVPLKDLYAVELNAAYEKNPKRLRVGQLVYRPSLPAAVERVDNSLQWESQPLVAVIEEPLQEVVKLVRDEDHYVPDYEAYLQLEYPDMVELETQFVPYSKRQLRFLQRNRDALRQARAYDLENGTDTYWQIMSKMPTKRIGGVLNPLPKRKILLRN